jgi:hypothetical protein
MEREPAIVGKVEDGQRSELSHASDEDQDHAGHVTVNGVNDEEKSSLNPQGVVVDADLVSNPPVNPNGDHPVQVKDPTDKDIAPTSVALRRVCTRGAFVIDNGAPVKIDEGINVCLKQGINGQVNFVI